MHSFVVGCIHNNFTIVRFILAELDGVSRDLVLHPVHLTPDHEGDLPPSALVPFCSYQMESKLLGKERSQLNNLTLCDKFEPTILEGQICYSLDIAQMEKGPTKQGKTNGIFLLLDPYPYQLNSSATKKKEQMNTLQSFKVYIHTLSQFDTYGPGTFSMSTLKSITGTKIFKQLPDNQKKCMVHNQEKCQSDKFLDHVKKNCSCIPWPLMTDNSKEKVKSIDIPVLTSFHRYMLSVARRMRPV